MRDLRRDFSISHVPNSFLDSDALVDVLFFVFLSKLAAYFFVSDISGEIPVGFQDD